MRWPSSATAVCIERISGSLIIGATLRATAGKPANGTKSGTKTSTLTGTLTGVLQRLDLRGRISPEMPSSGAASRAAWAELLPANTQKSDVPVAAVRELLEQVRTQGNAAVRQLTERFDGVDVADSQVSHAELAAAWKRIPERLRNALNAAKRRISDYHSYELPVARTISTDGILINSISQSVDRAGIYVPGGLAAYPSTVLMTVLVARAAEVPEIVLCSPPGPASSGPANSGPANTEPANTGPAKLSDAVLAAAYLCEVEEVYAIGGVQAIAAMAYGTETIAPVDVIAGPGNAWVAAAQREVADQVGVAAAFAGPSEIAVVADNTCPATSAAVDLVLQAEHGPGGRAWLLTWDDQYAQLVEQAVATIAAMSPRRSETLATLSRDGYVCLVDTPAQAIAAANAIAPEHLQLMCADAAELAEQVRHAGAVFIGPWTPASLGDYVAGPSHVLPTNGTARFAGALGVADFQKQMHVIEATRDGFENQLNTVVSLAESEGLWAHAASVAMRKQWADEGLGEPKPDPGNSDE